MHVAEVRGLGVGGREAETTGVEALAQQRLEPRLEERNLTGRESADLRLVDVDAEHVEPELGHADRVGRAEVTRAEDREPWSHSATG